MSLGPVLDWLLPRGRSLLLGWSCLPQLWVSLYKLFLLLPAELQAQTGALFQKYESAHTPIRKSH